MGGSCCCMLLAFGVVGGALFGLSAFSKKQQTPEEKEQAKVQKELEMIAGYGSIWDPDVRGTQKIVIDSDSEDDVNQVDLYLSTNA